MKKHGKVFFKYDNQKRFLDFISSLIVLILLSPLLLLISLAIYFFDEGPIFFRQLRVGKDGRKFLIYKFRTMKINKNILEEDGKNIETKDDMIEPRKRYKTTLKNDPRISFIGKFLRPIHLDELPQLINVISGEMSIVGPRPDAPVQEIDYSELFWKKRISIKPGITGYAQLHQCPLLSDRNFYDEIYIKKRNFIFDFLIIVRTFLKIIVFKSN